MADELFNPSELMAVLEDLARDVREGYISQLEKHDRRATGNLIDSVHTTIEVNGSRYIVWIHLADYWKYVEEGTRPHWPPPSAILKWIEAKPVIPRPDSSGRIPTPKQLAFLIGRKISEVGTAGSHDLKQTEDAVIPFYEQRIAEALHRDVLNYIEKVMP